MCFLGGPGGGSHRRTQLQTDGGKCSKPDCTFDVVHRPVAERKMTSGRPGRSRCWTPMPRGPPRPRWSS
eukprot:5773676-Alexandrium_andersonii.AAC.1